MTTPVRRLYAALVELGSAEELHQNLRTLASYEALVGYGEARFCEWVYGCIELGSLARELSGNALRHSDTVKLAQRCGLDVKGTAPLESLRKALSTMGIRERQPPPQLHDGRHELLRVENWLKARCLGRQDESFEDFGPEGPAGTCRKGLERMLKVLLMFLSSSGCEDVIAAVNSQGLHGFKSGELKGKAPLALEQLDAGTANHLLRAVEEELTVRGRRPPYLHPGAQLWGEAFDWVQAITKSLNTFLHDKGMSLAGRHEDLLKAVEQLRDKSSGTGAPLRLPSAIQFYRRFEDGMSAGVRHYEGLTSSRDRISCWECTTEYELHRPYMFLAATNPSAVDMVCTEIPDLLFQPVKA